MARQKVSYEQVAAAAEALLGESKPTTYDNVRARIGTGSKGTIAVHMRNWKNARPPSVAVAPELSTIAHEIDRLQAEARAEIRTQLVEAEAECAELAAFLEELEAERDRLIDQLADMTSQRDAVAENAEELNREIARLNKDIDREKETTERYRLAVASAGSKSEMQEAKLAEQAEQIRNLTSALQAENRKRSDAEKAAAVTEVRLRATEELLRQARDEIVRLKEELGMVQKAAIEDRERADAIQQEIVTQVVKRSVPRPSWSRSRKRGVGRRCVASTGKDSGTPKSSKV